MDALYALLLEKFLPAVKILADCANTG